VATRCSRRSSIHRTGRPRCLARWATSTSSGYTLTLGPKPPPTSGAITRTRSSASPSISEIRVRTANGTWVEDHTVSSSRPPSQAATTPRVSSGLPPVRGTTTRSDTLPAASWNARSGSPTSTVKWACRLPGIASCTWGAAGPSAASGSTTAGSSRSRSSSCSRASSASARDPATTAASAWPT
jgi:hypothetical protein